MSDKPEGRLSRLARLGGITSKVTTSYLGNKVRDAFRTEEGRVTALDKLNLDNAREVAEQLSRMKGAAMKLGQQMAMASSALDLPAEVTATLGKLHAEAEPVAFSTIKSEIERELGKPLDQLYARFDTQPLGTASLGQAHAAALPDGREVVVKVLHRGVEDSVTTDLMAVKAVLVGGRVLRRPKHEINAMFAEIEARLREELDYLQEAANLHVFGQLFAKHDFVRIPAHHPSHCTTRVLTLDRLSGVPIDAFIATADQATRDKAANNLAELYYHQVFRYRTLHADPHPGNFLFEPDGRIGLLDFGCVKRTDEFFAGRYARAALGTLHNDKQLALQACIDLGAWDGKNPAAGDALWGFLSALGKGFRSGPIVLGADGESLLEEFQAATTLLMKHPEVTLPRDILFLHRALGGLYTLSRQIKGVVDYGPILSRHAELAVATAEGRG